MLLYFIYIMYLLKYLDLYYTLLKRIYEVVFTSLMAVVEQHRQLKLHGRLIDNRNNAIGEHFPLWIVLGKPIVLFFRGRHLLVGTLRHFRSRQRPASPLSVQYHRHFRYQVVLELAQHQIVFDLKLRNICKFISNKVMSKENLVT